MNGRRWNIFRLRLRSLLARSAVERELAKELQFHLESQIEEARTHGLSPEDAAIAARRRLGGLTQIQEECRDTRRTAMLETTLQDLKYTIRTLLKTPGFTAILVLTLALSIGATTAIVSVVEGVLLRPLPFQDPARLVRAYTRNQTHPKFPVNPNDFRDARARMHAFESFAAYVHTDLQLSGAGDPVRLGGFAVTARYFHVLGLKPALGREFQLSDELPGRGNIVIISHRLWRERLQSAPAVLGATIRLDQKPYTIVGVMPPAVQHPGNAYHAVIYGDSVDAWIPFTFDSPSDRGSHYLDAIARLRPGVTLAQAQGEFLATLQQIAREHFGTSEGIAAVLSPLETEIVGQTRPLLFALLGAVGLVLILACVNAANLLLARATARQREMAVRAAIGAGRARIIRQLLTESLLLSCAGGLLGSVIAIPGTKFLVALLPSDFPRAADIHIDAPVFFFTLFLAVANGLLFGLVPALNASWSGPRAALHESSRSSTSSRFTLRLRSLLVIGEITFACALLIAAGLMLRSFLNLLHTAPGFEAEKVLTASLSLPRAAYKDTPAIAQFSRSLLDKIRALPAVRQAGIASDLPWTGWDDNAGGFSIRGETPPPHSDFQARYHMASAGFFSALGIPVLRGREFSDNDTAASQKTLIINQAMARYWQNGDALGGKVTFSDHPKESDWMTVVGIVRDVKDTPGGTAAPAAFWWPQPQQPFPFSQFSLAIRSEADPALLSNHLRAALHQLDPSLPLADVRTMDRIADRSYSSSRFAFALIALFAALALLMSAMGVYGVIAYSVGQRTLEFGIRMALGAKPRNLVVGVIRHGAALALWGTLAGLLLGLAFSRVLAALLYQVSGADPLTFALAALVGIAAAGAACLLPAFRATRVSPMAALRAE